MNGCLFVKDIQCISTYSICQVLLPFSSKIILIIDLTNQNLCVKVRRVLNKTQLIGVSMPSEQSAGYNKKDKMTTASHKKEQETVQDILEIAQAFQPIPERGITAAVARYFGIRTRRDETGEHIAHYFPYYKLIDGDPILKGFKKRNLQETKKSKKPMPPS